MLIVDFGSRPRQAHNRATTARPCTSRLQTHIHQVPQSVFLRAPFVSPGSLPRLPAAAAATRLIQQRHPACVSSFVDSDRLSSSTRPAFSACRQTPLPQLWVLVVSTSVSRAHVFPLPCPRWHLDLGPLHRPHPTPHQNTGIGRGALKTRPPPQLSSTIAVGDISFASAPARLLKHSFFSRLIFPQQRVHQATVYRARGSPRQQPPPAVC